MNKMEKGEINDKKQACFVANVNLGSVFNRGFLLIDKYIYPGFYRKSVIL